MGKLLKFSDYKPVVKTDTDDSPAPGGVPTGAVTIVELESLAKAVRELSGMLHPEQEVSSEVRDDIQSAYASITGCLKRLKAEQIRGKERHDD